MPNPNSSIIKLDSLPLSLYRRIPLSIKVRKNEYLIEELPFEIRSLISEHIKKDKIEYDTKVYDGINFISEYGDLKVIDNLVDLILEYIKNYFQTNRGEYPFNGVIGSGIKKLLNKKDSTLQNLLVNEEMNDMVRTFNMNKSFGDKISVKNANVDRKVYAGYIEYDINIDIMVGDELRKIHVEYVI